MGTGPAGIIACMYRILNIWFGWNKLNISYVWNGGKKMHRQTLISRSMHQSILSLLKKMLI